MSHKHELYAGGIEPLQERKDLTARYAEGMCRPGGG
jgi:hypothetical protein